MKDAKFTDIKCLIEFMYKGEINVEHVSLSVTRLTGIFKMNLIFFMFSQI
jgi:hypothetical protein